MNNNKAIISRKTFLDLCAAAEGARSWMATQAPGTDWANRVRADLHNAISAAVTEQPEDLHRLSHIQPALTAPTLAVLELAAQTESLLNLYMQAKRELYMATGTVPMNVDKFPIVESVRAQIKTVRNSISGE